jgi:UDP-N-acetylmuramoylalanine--D-glutamate ligase
LDYFNNFSDDWFSYTKIKIKGTGLNIFLNKKILIYGLGKSGLSAFKFLKNKSDIFLYDDYKSKVKTLDIQKSLISYKNISKSKFDHIILSPGIDINKCKLSKFLKKNYSKIYSDLDVFFAFFKNDCITITGTNGKSTTCQLMYEVMLNQKIDVQLVGNIGNPILSVKNVKKKTIFVIEASSYQLEYSKIFKSKYAAILNLSLDHIERHKTLDKYIKAKFKLFKNQSKGDLSFVKKDDLLINKELKSNKFISKVIKINTKKINKFLENIENKYFLTDTNKENLAFVLEISKKLKFKRALLIKTIQKFNGLKYRQQIILKRKYLTIINDSKSTSFSSSIGVLQANHNIYWLLGGIYKKGDKFNLSKKYFNNIKAFIYGKNKNFFSKKLKGKIDYKNFDNLKDALKKVFTIIKKEKFINKTILFSPCAASFDSFKNFEDRGLYFNNLIKKHINGI